VDGPRPLKLAWRPVSVDPSISKNPDRIAAMFDAIAARYDFLNHLLSAGIDASWRRRAIASLQLTGNERVLDLCTGTADLAIAALMSTPSATRVVGVDFAHEMLRIGHAKVQRARLERALMLARADAMQLPIADESVDAAMVAFGIRNVERPDEVCREMHRVVRPQGRFAILEFAIPTTPVFRAVYLTYFRHVLPRLGRIISGHDAAYGYLPASVHAFATPEEFVKILRQTGFLEIQAVPLTFGSVFLYTGRR